LLSQKESTLDFSTKKNNDILNPPSGTVVDRGIVLHHESPHLKQGEYQFFITAQKPKVVRGQEQGSVSPTQYHVIYDDSGVSCDIIQRLSFKLCHLYFNWSGTVKVPAPCQYAHKAAKLCGEIGMDPKSVPEKLKDKLYYL